MIPVANIVYIDGCILPALKVRNMRRLLWAMASWH